MSATPPWADFVLTLRAYLAGKSDILAVYRSAEACSALTPAGETAAHACALNALKNMCMAWPNAPEPKYIEDCVRMLLQTLDAWPRHLHAPTRRFSRGGSRGVHVYKPYWLERD